MDKENTKIGEQEKEKEEHPAFLVWTAEGAIARTDDKGRTHTHKVLRNTWHC